jgi:iron uptake system component EfeO
MKNIESKVAGALVAAALGMGGCGGSDAPDQQSVARAMQQSLTQRLTDLRDAAKALQAAAPTPVGRGWDKDMDAQAIADMKTAWMKARQAYEHVEGATAPIYSDLDASMDERYDGFLATPEGAADKDLFDGEGITGMHAIERILYADVTPASVVTFEMTLPGHAAGA